MLLALVGIFTTIIAFFVNYRVGRLFFDEKKSRKIDVVHMACVLLIFHIIVVISICGILLQNLNPILLTGVSLIVSLTSVVVLSRQWSQSRNLFIPKHVTENWNLNSIVQNEEKEFKMVVSEILQAAKIFVKEMFKNKVVRFFIILFMLVQVLIVVRIVTAPPNVLDSQGYHLPISAQWYQKNSIHLFDDVPVGRFNYATKAQKMLNFWFLAYAGGNIKLIELL